MKKLLLPLFIFSCGLFAQNEVEIIEDLIIKNDIETALSIMSQQVIPEKEKRKYVYLYVWAYFMQGNYTDAIEYIKKLGMKIKDRFFYDSLVIADYIYYKMEKRKNARRIHDYIIKSNAPLKHKLGVILIDNFFNRERKHLDINFIIDYMIRDYTSTLEQRIVCKPLKEIEREWEKIKREKKELEVLKLLLDEKKKILSLKEDYLKKKEKLLKKDKNLKTKKAEQNNKCKANTPKKEEKHGRK